MIIREPSLSKKMAVCPVISQSKVFIVLESKAAAEHLPAVIMNLALRQKLAFRKGAPVLLKAPQFLNS